jgi:hypothetical protein
LSDATDSPPGPVIQAALLRRYEVQQFWENNLAWLDASKMWMRRIPETAATLMLLLTIHVVE